MNTASVNTVRDILGKTIPYLSEKGMESPRLEADLMLAWVLGIPRIKLYSDPDRPLNSAELQCYREIIVKRVQGWPLAYLTGEKAFLSWDFRVTPAVLIPRPETELLVEKVVDLLKGRPGIRGIDVGTGSGAIGVTLAKLLPGSEWWAVDISNDALEVAGDNAIRLGVAERIRFMLGDLLEPVMDQGKFDVIVSNPPYVPRDVIHSLQPEVKREPVSALDGGLDGLDIYRRLIPQTSGMLVKNGILAMEHGSDQRMPLEAILGDSGFEYQAFTDLAGLDRILIGKKKE